MDELTSPQSGQTTYTFLSFEFGDGGVYVSEEPDMTFSKDTDGDGKADFRRKVLSGFGWEDSSPRSA